MGTADRGEWIGDDVTRWDEWVAERTGACWWLWALLFPLALWAGFGALVAATAILAFGVLAVRL